MQKSFLEKCSACACKPALSLGPGTCCMSDSFNMILTPKYVVGMAQAAQLLLALFKGCMGLDLDI